MSEDKIDFLALSREEQRIIQMMRELQYGELIVSVQHGAPIRAEIKWSVLLSDSEKRKQNRP